MQSLTWETIHSTVHSCHRSTILCLVQAGKPVWTFSRLTRRLSAVLTPDITTSKDGKAGWIFLGRVSDFCYS